MIGYDWKTYTFSSGGYQISNDLCYFIKDRNDNIFRLVLEEFEGSSTGKVVLMAQTFRQLAYLIKIKLLKSIYILTP